jgi:hypothetical protein
MSSRETRNAHKMLVVIPLEKKKRRELGYLNFGEIN